MLEIKSRHLTWVGPKSGWDKIERIFGLHFLILFGNKGNITKKVEVYLYLGSSHKKAGINDFWKKYFLFEKSLMLHVKVNKKKITKQEKKSLYFWCYELELQVNS